MKNPVNFAKKASTVVCIILSSLCAVIVLVLPHCDIKIYNHTEIAKRLILSSILTMLIGILVSLTVLFYKAENRSRKVRLISSIITFILMELLLFTGYIAPVPQLYGNVATNPIKDLKKAMCILSDDSESVTVIGIFSSVAHKYGITEGLYTYNYTLKGEDGTEFISNGEQTGIYTITYSLKTKIPEQIISYDYNCGENILKWYDYSEIYPEWTSSELPPVKNVYSLKLDFPYPLMKLQITHNGEVIESKTYRNENTSVGLSQYLTQSGTYVAQLYAVYHNPNSYGAEYLIPISNAAELTLK